MSLDFTPTIHLNGTSKASLMEQVLDAAKAVGAARAALGQAWPHGRDYYPQGPNALKIAEVQFGAWSAQLNAIHTGLMELAVRIDQAGR